MNHHWPHMDHHELSCITSNYMNHVYPYVLLFSIRNDLLSSSGAASGAAGVHFKTEAESGESIDCQERCQGEAPAVAKGVVVVQCHAWKDALGRVNKFNRSSKPISLCVSPDWSSYLKMPVKHSCMVCWARLLALSCFQHLSTFSEHHWAWFSCFDRF